jgi:hypothetical protein
MKFLILLLVAAFGFTAFGITSVASPRTQATFSRTFPFPISSLEKVEQAMQTAAARTGKAMQTEVTYQIDSNFNVRCAEQSPTMYDGHLYGCVLATTLDLGGTQVTLANLLYLTQSSKEISDLLAKTDMQTTDSVALKSPFDGGHGSQYFCNAEGTPGARQWACYLYFVD